MADQPLHPVIDYRSPPEPKAPKAGCFGRGLVAWAIFIGACVLLFLLLNQRRVTRTAISPSDLAEELKSGNVAEMTLENDELHGALKTGAERNFRVALTEGMGSDWSFVEWLLIHRNGAVVRLENNQNLLVNLLVPLIPWLLIFGFIWFFVFRQIRRSALAQSAPPKPIPVYIVQPETR